jgi:hypothetical protein
MNLIHKWGNTFFELQGHTHLMALKDVAFVTPHADQLPNDHFLQL